MRDNPHLDPALLARFETRLRDQQQVERRRLLFAPIPIASLGATVHGRKIVGGGAGQSRHPVFHPDTHCVVGWMSGTVARTGE